MPPHASEGILDMTGSSSYEQEVAFCHILGAFCGGREAHGVDLRPSACVIVVPYRVNPLGPNVKHLWGDLHPTRQNELHQPGIWQWNRQQLLLGANFKPVGPEGR